MSSGHTARNEVRNEEMIEILKHLHRYFPTTSDGSQLIQIGFAGDQLTAVRARQTMVSRVNSQNSSDALRGLVPFACDWHAKVNFLSVSQISMYLCGRCSRSGPCLQSVSDNGVKSQWV